MHTAKNRIGRSLLLLPILQLLLYGIMAQNTTPAKNNFAIRAFHLDLRIQVMRMPALKKFALQLSREGLNTLIIEYEATYPFEQHPLIANRYAYTKKEVSSFVQFCKGIGMEVIPLQQSFGHVEYILRHYRYAALREDEKNLSQVCPLETEKDSLLFTDLYRELASTHTSPYIHIGGDETYLLGHCAKCRAKVEKEGISKLYIDYISMLCHIVTKLGRRPVLWADIALKYPESLKLLPRETIFVDWNYGWDLNRFGNHQKLVESGFEIWGAPALRSHPDNYYLTQWEKHFNNIRDFVPFAKEMGYKGIVMTSWSTSGAYSYLYESENELTELYAIRHVYPITGFNILIAAFAKSIASGTGWDMQAFILTYGKEQYGFTPLQANKFMQALFTAPSEVNQGTVESKEALPLAALTDSAITAAKTFRSLIPLKNKTAFEHYRLMADIRVQYLQYLEIEQRVNADHFATTEISFLLKKLKVLMADGILLSKRFTALNKETLYPAAIQEENQLRNQRIELLYQRLSKAK